MAQEPTQKTTGKTRWRYTAVGSIVGSVDFYGGMTVGLACDFLPAFSRSVAANTQTVMLGVTAVAGALVALVLTAMTVLIAVIGPVFSSYLDRTRHGLPGLLRPYHVVIAVCAASCAVAIIVALGWPAIQSIAALRFLGVGVPTGLLLWGLGGCLQIIHLTSRTVSQSHQVADLEERRQTAAARSRGENTPD